jgi:type II secretory pathway predicted ATPase ExeA
MYKSFFGLRERPFNLVPDPRYLFMSTRQREAFSTLKYALTGPRGLTLLLGEAGTGKTTLVQAALFDGGGTNAQCVLLSNPTLTRNEFYEFLANAFGLPREAARSKTEFLFALRQHLEERQAQGLLTALVIDEAQSLSFELLEEVRLLSNMETQTEKLVSVVLAGQLELGDRLNDSRLRQLKQRIALRCQLAPLELTATAAYIAGRIRIAGGSPAEIFTRDAVAVIYNGSGGVPRVINVICENALIGGFAAQIKPVPKSIVEEVLRDFDLRAARQDAPAVVDTRMPEPVVVGEPESGIEHEHEPAAAANAPVFGTFGRKRRFSFF